MVYGDTRVGGAAGGRSLSRAGQLLQKQAYHLEPEADPFHKELDKNDPLYCKPCAKLFAKETVFKAHLLGKKHIQALKRCGKVQQAMALESKASMKNKLEAKRKRQEEAPAVSRPYEPGQRSQAGGPQEPKSQPEKSAKLEAAPAEPRFEPNYSSLSACLNSCREQEKEEDRLKEAAKIAQRRKEAEAANRCGLSGAGLTAGAVGRGILKMTGWVRRVRPAWADWSAGPKAMPEDPMKNEVAVDWWKGTAHAQGPKEHTFDESTRGMW